MEGFPARLPDSGSFSFPTAPADLGLFAFSSCFPLNVPVPPVTEWRHPALTLSIARHDGCLRHHRAPGQDVLLQCPVGVANSGDIRGVVRRATHKVALSCGSRRAGAVCAAFPPRTSEAPPGLHRPGPPGDSHPTPQRSGQGVAARWDQGPRQCAASGLCANLKEPPCLLF